MDNLNKITHTRVGDSIHYYINGKEGRGTVVKMNSAYVSVLKESGNIDEIHINDTFFIKDIITNKSWNDMDFEERTEQLQKAHAYSPRFLYKTWEQLPKELKAVLSKTNIEDSTHGQIGGNRAGVSTDTDVETPEDYKGESKDDKKEEFKHEHQEKPTVDKNNGIEESHKEEDSMQEDWRKTGGQDDKNKNYVNKYQQGGKFVNTPSVGGGTTASQMADTFGGKKVKPAKHTQDTKYFDDKGKPITAEQHEASGGTVTKATWERWLSKTLNRPSGFAEEGARTRKEGVKEGERPTQDNPFPKTKIPKGHKAPTGVGKPRHGGHGYNTGNASRFNTSISDASKRGLKKYGQPHYGVTTLDKEGDGAGNSGVISTETTGVYNPRNVNSDGRYRDQERDRKDERDSRN